MLEQYFILKKNITLQHISVKYLFLLRSFHKWEDYFFFLQSRIKIQMHIDSEKF